MKTDFESMQEQRTYIRNLVDRKLKFVPKCSVCGSEDVTIIHNFKHPYVLFVNLVELEKLKKNYRKFQK